MQWQKSPKLLKRFVELNPSILQNHQVVDIFAKFKRNAEYNNYLNNEFLTLFFSLGLTFLFLRHCNFAV